MSTHNELPPPTEAELHAWVDGQLPPTRAQAVGRWLDNHPSDAQRVSAWKAQREGLQALGKKWLDDPVPAALTQTVKPAASHWPWRQGLAAGLLLAVGFSGGWALRPPEVQLASLPNASPVFVREAVAAHVVYVPEQRHPVEVGAQEHEHLVNWLSKRLGTVVKAPLLTAEGYSLMGGRLLAGESGAPRALFMYENAAGVRITLHISTLSGAPRADPAKPIATEQGAEQAAFKFSRMNEVETFYWVEQGLGYALSGSLPRSDMAALASQVYRQLLP